MIPIFIKVEDWTGKTIYLNICQITAIMESNNGLSKIYQTDGADSSVEINCDMMDFINRIEKYLISES